MPLIVDANIASELFRGEGGDFLPVYLALASANAKLIYGGRLTTEYLTIGAAKRMLVLLDRQGTALAVNDSLVNQREQQLIDAGSCVSDDQHIIALAQVGNARLLCSRDQALHQDFGNKALLDNPRGKVYQNPTHAPLIRTHGK